MKLSLSRLIGLIVLGVMTLILVSAWNRITSPRTTSLRQPLEDCRVVSHAAGEACIPTHPKRVLTLERISFSTAVALGIKPIGTIEYTSTEYDAPYLRGKTDGIRFLHSVRGQPNLENILQLKPDLIMANSAFKNVYPLSSKIASTVLVPFPVKEQNKWSEYLENMATMLNKTVVAQQLLQEYEQRVEQLKSTLSVNNQHICVSFLYIFHGTVQTVGKNSFVGKILNDLGLERPSAQTIDAVWIPLSEEALPDLDSDILFVLAFREEDNFYLEQLKKKPLWSHLKVVQQNQVYQVNAAVWDGRNILAAFAVLDDIEKYLLKQPFSANRPSS